MEKKQTATEWLFERLMDTPQDKFEWYAILQQAKKMEKDQIANSWVHGAVGLHYKTVEEYYNKVYGTK
jgi:hypothetical protein